MKILTRYSRFISNAIISYCKNSRIGVPTKPIQESASTTFRNSTLQKRFYYTYRTQHGWFHNPIRVGTSLLFFTCGAAIAVSSGYWVTVPYTGRTHFVLFHSFLPDELMAIKGEIVSPLPPDYAMAQEIFQDIIRQALPLEMEIQRDLELQNERQELEMKSRKSGIKIKFPRFVHDKNLTVEKCEVVVVYSPKVAVTSCGRFGKIYVTTAFLDFYGENEDVMATMFGHEVAHDLARHAEEKLSQIISLVSGIGMSLYLFCKSTYIRSNMPFLEKYFMRRRFLPSFSFVVTVGVLSYFPMMKYWRKMVLEADYIGLNLASSAGYNIILGLLFPVYKTPLSLQMLPECFYPYPSPGRRCQHMNRPEVLSEVMSKFRHRKNPPPGPFTN